jgi:hypothetical protein
VADHWATWIGASLVEYGLICRLFLVREPVSGGDCHKLPDCRARVGGVPRPLGSVQATTLRRRRRRATCATWNDSWNEVQRHAWAFCTFRAP